MLSHFHHNNIGRLKVKGLKKIYHAHINQKKAGMAILISDKGDIKSKKITGDRGGLYIMIRDEATKIQQYQICIHQTTQLQNNTD